MVAQKGREVLIKVDTDGMGTFATLTGIRSKSIVFNSETVDVSDGDSANQWRELLAGAGLKSASVSGSGVFKDGATEEDVRGYWFSGAIQDYQFIMPDFGTFEGPFQITSLEYAGEYNGEATSNISFESAGEIAFTAA